MDNQLQRDMRVLQININGCSDRSVMSLNKYINDKMADIVCISETKTGNDLHFDNFTALLKPNIDSHRGGVALLVHKSATVDRISELEKSDVDVLVSVVTIGKKRLLVCSVYSPPNDKKKLCKALKVFQDVNSARATYRCCSTLIVGDLNARHFNWNNKICNVAGKELEKFCTENSLAVVNCLKHNTFVCNEGGSQIDLVVMSDTDVGLIRNQSIDEEVELFSGAPTRGHLAVWTELMIKPPKVKSFKKWCWNDTNWTDFHCNLDEKSADMIPWIQQTNDPYQMWQEVLTVLTSTRDCMVPQKTVSCHSKPYWNETLSILSAELRMARKDFKARSTYTNGDKLSTAKAEFEAALIKAKRDHLEEQTKELDQAHASQFWSYFKRTCYKKSDNNIGTLRDGGDFAVSDQQKAELLYQDIFLGKHLDGSSFDDTWKKLVEDKLCQPLDINNEVTTILSSKIAVEEICKALGKTTTSNKSADADGIHPLMVRNCGPQFQILLFILFNKCLETQIWPWSNHNNVIFLRKPGKADYSHTSAYRPITISSYIGKLLERVLEARIRNFVESNGLIPTTQHGFRSNNSTTTYLTKLITTVQHNIASKERVAGVFLDLQKAFDSVWLDGMLFRLMEIGIGGPLLGLLSSFLNGRTITLTVNGFISDRRPVTVGLPQGSVLSPLLFIIFIRDMLAETEGLALQFADDCTIIAAHKDNTALSMIHQKNCDQVAMWMNRWRITANCAKTDLINFTSQIQSLHINGENINVADETKVLGVIIDSKLTFQLQRDRAKNSLQRKWNLLKPFVHAGLSASTTRKILTTVMLPGAFYASHLWDIKNELKIYNVVKEMMHVPYNPPEELLLMLAGITPLLIGDISKRLSVLKQLISNKDTICITENTKSPLQKLFVADMVKLKGRGTEIDKLTTKDLRNSEIRKCTSKERSRKWETFLKLQSGSDGLAYHLEPNFLIKNPLPLNMDPKLLGKACSLFSGHCNLNLHRYRLGLSFSPTCVCLQEDETVSHHLFRCPNYASLREKLDISQRSLCIQQVIQYCTSTNRL